MFDDPRWDDSRDREERDRDSRDHSIDPRDVFMEWVDLPRGRERELVRVDDHEYTLRGSESRTLSTVGAFRVVSSRDLLDHDGKPTDPRKGDLRHLREQGMPDRDASIARGRRERDRSSHGTLLPCRFAAVGNRTLRWQVRQSSRAPCA